MNFGKAELAIPDSLWMQILGKFGLVGLLAAELVLLLPIWKCLTTGQGQMLAGRLELSSAVVVLMFLLDSMMNAMENPAYFVLAGAVVGSLDNNRAIPGLDHSNHLRGHRLVSRRLWPMSVSKEA